MPLFAPGDKAGPYEIVEKLGTGGMGEVAVFVEGGVELGDFLRAVSPYGFASCPDMALFH